MSAEMIRILLVGNDQVLPDWRTQATRITVIHVRSPEEAALHLRHRLFDIIILNLDLPPDVLIKVIRDLDKLGAPIPMILIVDQQGPDLVLRAIRHGAQDVLDASASTTESLHHAIETSIERKRLEQHRIRHAREDALTGLGNQLLLEERFARALARSDRHAKLLALVAIDIDQPDGYFGLFGTDFLPRLMPLIGQRLISVVRETDTLARTRDAGFAWLVEGLAVINDIRLLVDRLPDALAASFQLDDQNIHLTASVGVAVCPFHGRDFPTLLKMAEAAMLDVANLNGDGLLMPPLPARAEKEKFATIF